MDNSVDPQVIQTWKQARLRAFQSLLELTRTEISNKSRWEEDRDNAIGILEWALTTGLDEVKHSDCPDFIDLVIDMTERITKEELDIAVVEQNDLAMHELGLVEEAARKNKLEIKNYFEPEVIKRLQAIEDANKELHEVILPAQHQLEIKVKNGTAPYEELLAEHLWITTRLDELDNIFKINKEELEELKTRVEDHKSDFQVGANTNLENAQSVLKTLGNPQLNSDHLRKLLADFTIKTIFWLDKTAQDTSDVSWLARFIVRVFYAGMFILAKVFFFFKK